tara:strand:+ start:10165 stop:11814 length:1650 start_codon:yes stop_codon:yes gene_type:complete
MALVLADRVKETSTTTGTGTYTLAGAVTGFESFGSIGNGNTTYYACTLGSDFEVGIGTYTASGTTLARTTILQSSNSDNAVDWGAGTKTLFCTQPAEKAVFRDASGRVGIGTTSPSAPLHIAGTGIPTLKIEDTDTAGGYAHFEVNGAALFLESYDEDGTEGQILFKNANTEAMRIREDGKVGIGTSSPSTELEVVGDLTLTSTDAGTTNDPQLVLYRNSASPAVNDEIGEIIFKGRNDASQDVNYAIIESNIVDETDGTEDGGLKFRLRNNGADTLYLNMTSFFNVFYQHLLLKNRNIIFEGANEDNHETTLTVTEPTSDNTITLPDSTGTVLLTDGSGASLTNVNATTIDSLDSTQFLRSDSADTKTSGDLTFSDDVKAVFGTDGDAELYFDNTNSDLILNMSTDSDFMVMHGTEKQIVANNDSTVQLYHNNLINLETSSTGTIFYHGIYLVSGKVIQFEGATSNTNETTLTVTNPTADRTITLPDSTGTVLTTGNSDTPTTTTSSGDADFVLVDDGGTMKKITPSNLGITSGGTTAAFATAMAMVL